MIVLQAPVLFVWEIKLHQEEQVNAQTALPVVLLALETLQHATLALLALVLIVLQILVPNALVIKLLQEDKVPVHHAPLDAAHAQIMQPVQAAMLDSAFLMEFVLLVLETRPHLEIQVNALDALLDVLLAQIM